MQFFGATLAIVGTALIVLAALQLGASILGDSQELAVLLGVVGALLLLLGGGLTLRASRR